MNLGGPHVAFSGPGGGGGGGGTPFPISWMPGGFYTPGRPSFLSPPANTRLYFAPFIIPKIFPLEQVWFFCDNATLPTTAGAELYLGFYKDTGSWAPGTRVLTLGTIPLIKTHRSIPTTATSRIFLTLAVTIPVGIMWAAMMVRGATATAVKIAGGGRTTAKFFLGRYLPSTSPQGLGVPTWWAVGYKSNGAFAAMPATAPVVATLATVLWTRIPFPRIRAR